MALLEVRGLARPPLVAARDLDLDAGEIVVVRGPSGSGKTLFLRALADLDPADAQRIALGGRSRETFAAPAWRAALLYVHPDGIRLPGTVRENLERVAALVGPAEGGRTDGTLPSIEGVPDDRDARKLSGGEAQALALERALLVGPRVLLLDEATSAMDPDRAKRWERRLRDWVGEERAILWVAHDDRLADRLGAREERFP